MRARAPNPSSTRLRRALRGDAQALSEQGRAAFVEAFGLHYPPSDILGYCEETYGAGCQERELADDATAILLAEDEEGIVGHLKLGPTTLAPDAPGERSLEIKRLYLLSRAHGRGIAQSLLAAAFDEARTAGADHVYLSCWTENARALRFYEKEGFLVVGRHPFRTGETIDEDYVMCRAL